MQAPGMLGVPAWNQGMTGMGPAPTTSPGMDGLQGRVSALFAGQDFSQARPPMVPSPCQAFLGMPQQQQMAPPVQDGERQRSELVRAEKAAKDTAAEMSAFVGVIARFSHTTGVGYIECVESMGQFGSDVQIQRAHFSGLQVGDTVVFTVKPIERGGPQASFVKRLSELTQARRLILDGEAPLPSPGTVESAQEYLGFITTFQPDRGFGFVSCAQTRQMYGSDVYIHSDQFLDVQVGDGIHFRVAMNPKGMPVARGVRKTVAPDPTPAPTPAPAPASAAPLADAPVVRPEVQKMMAMAGFKAPPAPEAPEGSSAPAAPDAGRESKRRDRSASKSSMEVSKSPGRRKGGDKDKSDKADAGGAEKSSKKASKSRRSPSRDSSRSSRSRRRSRSSGSRSKRSKSRRRSPS